MSLLRLSAAEGEALRVAEVLVGRHKGALPARIPLDAPSPALCDRIKLDCSSASRSSGIRVLASSPKPVLTP